MIPDESFAKDEHLLKTKDFANVYKKGVSRKLGSIILYRLPNALGGNRLGFSISSRNVRLATRRNRIRRIFREIYRRRKKDLGSGFDIILVVKRDLDKTLSFVDLENSFLKLAREANLLA